LTGVAGGPKRGSLGKKDPEELAVCPSWQILQLATFHSDIGDMAKEAVELLRIVQCG